MGFVVLMSFSVSFVAKMRFFGFLLRGEK